MSLTASIKATNLVGCVRESFKKMRLHVRENALPLNMAYGEESLKKDVAQLYRLITELNCIEERVIAILEPLKTHWWWDQNREVSDGN